MNKDPLMSKYDPLKIHLNLSENQTITLSFSEIEKILGKPLPTSAFRHNAWWSNEVKGTHTQSNSWMDSGYRTKDLDLNMQRVTFRKAR